MCGSVLSWPEDGVGSTIVERDGVAAHASGYSAGGLNPLEGAGIPGPLGPLAVTSYRMHKEIWPDLTARSGIDFGPKVVSSVRVAFDEADVPEMEASFDAFDSADDAFSAAWLSAAELRDSRAAYLSRCAVRAGDIWQLRPRQLPVHSGAREVGGHAGS